MLILAPTALLFYDVALFAGILSLSAFSDLVLSRVFPKRSGFRSADGAPGEGGEAPHEPGRLSSSRWDWLVGAILLPLWVACTVTAENPGGSLFGQRLFWFILIGLPPLAAVGARMIARWLFRMRSRSEAMSLGDLFNVNDGSGLFLMLVLNLIGSSPRGFVHAVPLILSTLFFAGIYGFLAHGLMADPSSHSGTVSLVLLLIALVLLIFAGSCWVTLPEHDAPPPPRARRAPRKRATKAS